MGGHDFQIGVITHTSAQERVIVHNFTSINIPVCQFIIVTSRFPAMNLANQQALSHQTNQAVIEIRQLEVNYYTNLYGVFGTQGILLGGFVYGMFTQNNVISNNYGLNGIEYVYFIFAAATMAAALHILLSTMLLQVYGPGLALHGPIGSMARATEGLRIEQEHVTKVFTFMIITFSIATLCVFWMVMKWSTALTSTVAYILILRQSYYYAERIYLRFYWNESEKNWDKGTVEDDGFELEEDEPQIPGAAGGAGPQQTAIDGGSGREPTTAASYKVKKISLPFGLSFKSRRGDPGTEEARSTAGGGITSANGTDTATNSVRRFDSTTISGSGSGKGGLEASASPAKGLVVVMEGYFVARGSSEQVSQSQSLATVTSLLDSKKWNRQYFVLFRTGDLFVYKTRHAFRSDPKHPLFTRPLRLSDYHARVDNADQALRAEWENEAEGRSVAASSVVGAGSPRSGERKTAGPAVPLFQITLSSREPAADAGASSAEEVYGLGKGAAVGPRNNWLLRCDTEEELEIWVEALRDVCPSCLRT